MDAIPANATILICQLFISFSTGTAGSAQVIVYATDGDSTAALDSNDNKIAIVGNDHDVAIFGVDIHTLWVYIPLEPTNQDFRVLWTELFTDSTSIHLYYKGFMTD